MFTHAKMIRMAGYTGFGVVATSILAGIITGFDSFGQPLFNGSIVPLIALTIAQFALYTVFFGGQIFFAKKHGARLLEAALVTGIVWNTFAAIFFFLNYFGVLTSQTLGYAISSAVILLLAGIHTILRGTGLRKLNTLPTKTLSILFIMAGAGILFVPLLPAALIILMVADVLMSRLLIRDAN